MRATCPSCGAPAAPDVTTCGFCGIGLGEATALAGARPADWADVLTEGRVSWSAGEVTIETPANPANRVALRSHVQVADLEATVAFTFQAGQAWAHGVTTSAFGLRLRCGSGVAYEVSLATSGALSANRVEGGRLASWLLEPVAHPLAREGLGTRNELGARLVGERLVITLNDATVASLRGVERRAGAVELSVRPGSADARILVHEITVAEAS